MSNDHPGATGDHRGTCDVSVILVVRNGAEYIADALASVARSHRMPRETLVIDGGSTDATADVVARFPWATLVPQVSRGIASAYNEGVACARGALVAFISHDDIWMDRKLDRQVAHLEAHPEAECCVTLVQHEMIPGMLPPPGFRTELLERPVPGMIMECLVARRSVFERVGAFDPSFATGEDTDWYARARDMGVRIDIIPETMVRKRVHGTNASLGDPGNSALLLRALRRSVERKRQGAPDGTVRS